MAPEDAEARIRMLTEEVSRLRARVTGLEAFTRSAAHDLSAPLRQIRSFASRARAHPSADGTDRALAIVIQVADRASALVQRLLELSEGSARPLQPTCVSLDGLVASLREELGHELTEREVVWSVDALPQVEADETLLRAALGQLLRNALKYTRHCHPARIKVSGHRPSADEVVLCVTDNGAGFDPSLADRLFTPFHRLHSASAFEGHGIGLAIVRQIAERHGGRCWAEGQPGLGASFWLSLPRSLERREVQT